MKASKDPIVFGRLGAPDVEIGLPYFVRAKEVVLKVECDGRSSTSSWYEIWEAVNAVAYMCARSLHKGGKATRIGKSRREKIKEGAEV